MAGSFDAALRRLLNDAGCRFVRTAKGSHELWYSPVSNRHFTVSHNIKSKHTANAVLKQAGLPKAF